MTKPITFALFLIAATSLSACGQKGPLYLPKEDAAQPASESPAESTTEESTGE